MLDLRCFVAVAYINKKNQWYLDVWKFFYLRSLPCSYKNLENHDNLMTNIYTCYQSETIKAFIWLLILSLNMGQQRSVHIPCLAHLWHVCITIYTEQTSNLLTSTPASFHLFQDFPSPSPSLTTFYALKIINFDSAKLSVIFLPKICHGKVALKFNKHSLISHKIFYMTTICLVLITIATPSLQCLHNLDSHVQFISTYEKTFN